MVLYLATATASCRVRTTACIFRSNTLSLSNRFLRRHSPSSHRAMSSPASNVAKKALAPGASLTGQSGRIYTIQEILLERLKARIYVYRARADGQDFIVKTVIPGEWDYQQALQKSVASCPNLRTVVDGIPDPGFFVYPYLKTDLLQFSQRNLTEATRKSMLRSALVGLAALHEKWIIHTDIKPNNILVDYDEQSDGSFSVNKVQISDMEDAVIISEGKYLRQALCGNQMWRSPESWARAGQGTPSDIFSFGVVCVYVILDHMALSASEEELAASDSWRYILRKQVDTFGDDEGFKGLLFWIGEENPFLDRLIDIAESFDAANPRKPLAKWTNIDAEFRDLVSKMTNLDPGKRITAREALKHPWFANSD